MSTLAYPTESKKLDFFFTIILGIMISVAWAAFIIWLNASTPNSALISQPWYILMAGATFGSILWMIIEKSSIKTSIAILTILIIILMLGLYLNIKYEKEENSFYFGFIFFKDTGIAGFLCYLLSSTLINLISGISKDYRFGPPTLFIGAFLGYLATNYIHSLMLWTVFVLSCSAALAIITDISIFLRWELSKTKRGQG